MAPELQKAIRLEARTSAVLKARGPALAGDLAAFGLVHIGAEFCENLLPSPAELVRQARYFHGLGKKVCFLTPLVSEAGLRRLGPCLKALAAQPGPSEVTVNDIGAAALARRLAPQLELNLGRLLYDNVFLYRRDALRLINPAALRFFAGLGIRRFELSAAGAFPKTNFSAKEVRPLLKEFSVSFYYPYLNMSTARACMTGMRAPRAGEPFAGVKCRRECTAASFEVEHPLVKETLVVRGNTVFTRFTDKFYSSEKSLARLNAGRLVYCPFP